MNEAETRAELIDPLLAAAGWGVVEGSRIRREFPITPGRIEGGGRRGKPLSADYVLIYRNTHLTVVEAKADTLPLSEGVGQAKDYAAKQIRFTDASSGSGIYAVDMDTGVEAELAAFPTPDELWQRTFAAEIAWRDRFAAIPYADKGGSWQIRYYQEIAVTRALEAIAAGRDRNIERNIPTLLTTSQKLSTGVDARNVRNTVLLRPVNSMIEFMQIIGRGTRLYDGKDYFTIYDYVKAHHHFSDPEWDGEPEPLDEMVPRVTGPRQETPDTRDSDQDQNSSGKPRRSKARIQLGDGKERSTQHMMVTSFWQPDGRPMSSQQFITLLYGELPEFVKDEAELRVLWSAPETRSKLLQGLAEKGFGPAQLAEMQTIIEAENSDRFDVLAHVAYALRPIPREARAEQARFYIHPRRSWRPGCAFAIRTRSPMPWPTWAAQRRWASCSPASSATSMRRPANY